MSDFFLQSVDNAMQVLLTLGDNGDELGLSEISKRLGLGKSTTHRLLSTLERRGFVVKSPDSGKYKLGIRIVHLGRGVLQNINVIKESRPHMEELSRNTGESTHLSLYSQGEITFVHKVTGQNPAIMGSVIGMRKPAYSTATGKALMAFLPQAELEEYLATAKLQRITPNTIDKTEKLRAQLQQVRECGFSEDQQESEEGLVCFAAPVRNITGEVIAAVSVSGAASRMNDRREKLIAMVKDTADTISKSCGCCPDNQQGNQKRRKKA